MGLAVDNGKVKLNTIKKFCFILLKFQLLLVMKCTALVRLCLAATALLHKKLDLSQFLI